MSVNSKMTALADEIRELSGTTDTKSLDEMKVDVDAANTEITEQAELITQITTALEGKAGGVTLPTLDNPAVAADILNGKEAIDGNGNVITGTITTKTSSNLAVSGATVTVPAGYYATNASKSVSTATQATPSVSIDSTGKITASATQSAGYVSAGTKTGTKQLTTQAAKTITPSTSSQTAVASGVYTTGAVTVAAIPSSYVQPSGTKNITTNGTYDVKSYASVSVSVNSSSGDYEIQDAILVYDSKLVALTNAVTALEQELAGKAAVSGSDVDTCTVTITSDSGTVKGYSFTVFENGAVNTKHSLASGTLSTPIVINNVVCNSMATLFATYVLPGFNITNGVIEDAYGISGVRSFKLAAEKDSNVTINCYNDD